TPPPPRSTPFPYTTLFRSHEPPREQRRKCHCNSRTRTRSILRRRTRRHVDVDLELVEVLQVDVQPLALAADVAERGLRAFLHYRSEEHTSELQSLRHLVCR